MNSKLFHFEWRRVSTSLRVSRADYILFVLWIRHDRPHAQRVPYMYTFPDQTPSQDWECDLKCNRLLRESALWVYSCTVRLDVRKTLPSPPKGPDCGCQRKTSKSVKIAVGYTYIIYTTVVLVKSAVIVGIAARIPVLGQDWLGESIQILKTDT